jgi:hypothetical protein
MIAYEPRPEKLFVILPDGIDFTNILAPSVKERLDSKSALPISPLVTKGDIPKEPPLHG